MKKIIISLIAIIALVFGIKKVQNDHKTNSNNNSNNLSEYIIGFYNVQDLNNEADENKYENISQVLNDMGENQNFAFVGLAEVENEKALKKLINSNNLKERNYRYIINSKYPYHNCALIYDENQFSVKDYELIKNKEDKNARGFLLVKGQIENDEFAVIVCHLPSRRKIENVEVRIANGEQLNKIKENLLKENPDIHVVIMGDMNDNPFDDSMIKGLEAKETTSKMDIEDLFNPWYNTKSNKNYTETYQKEKNLFDQIIISGNLLKEFNQKEGLKYKDHKIFQKEYLFENGKIFRGDNGGYSDHLPVRMWLSK